MTVAELLSRKDEAVDLEQTTGWRRIMPYLTPIKCIRVDGEVRRYYFNGAGRLYYRRVAECELYRDK